MIGNILPGCDSLKDTTRKLISS